MSISRRHFIRASAVTVAAAGTTVSLNASAAERAARAGAAAPQPAGPALFTREMFAPHLHTTFLVSAQGGRPVPVELIELRDYEPARQAARAGRESFVLHFRAPANHALRQETCRFEHRALGEFDLLVAPIKTSRHGQVYEAVINHVRS